MGLQSTIGAVLARQATILMILFLSYFGSSDMSIGTGIGIGTGAVERERHPEAVVRYWRAKQP